MFSLDQDPKLVDLRTPLLQTDRLQHLKTFLVNGKGFALTLWILLGLHGSLIAFKSFAKYTDLCKTVQP
jgi:hypothetical protein